ncbi:GNAT family N-acetyltransferase [Paenibacillus tarimensis]
MIEIQKLQNRMDLFDEAVRVFWGQWGSQTNYNFYHDCMFHSCHSSCDLPRFFIAVQDDSIIGTYALLRNELISRQDLYPWLACLYVVPELRGRKLGSVLLNHAVEETGKKGFKNLYLSTDLNGYYEKYGWTYLSEGFMLNGDPTKIFVKQTI